MTCTEFLSVIKSHGALFAPPATMHDISLANAGLQQMRAAMLPKFMMELYEQCGGINLDCGYIFGPSEIRRGTKYPIPDILKINTDLASLPQLHGRTIFGRNDLFWFGFDSFGTCYMLNNLTLGTLRTYNDPWRAMSDCLIAGKF